MAGVLPWSASSHNSGPVVTTTAESLDRGMGMGLEVDELATARPGLVGRRDAVCRPPACGRRATHAVS